MEQNYPFPYETAKFGDLELGFLSEGGPRLVSLSYQGSENILAETPEKIEETSHGTYHFVGGHRLWVAPEVKDLTYLPDDSGLTIKRFENGLDLIGPVDPVSKLQKRIILRVDSNGAEIKLEHQLENLSDTALNCALWSITMLKPGGIFEFPVGHNEPNPDGFLPDRNLSLWPYTRWDDPRVKFHPAHLGIDTRIKAPYPGKWGTLNAMGGLRYHKDDFVFIKLLEKVQPGVYPDFGCNAETYVCDQFIEVESLSPLRQLLPGERMRLYEIWHLSRAQN